MVESIILIVVLIGILVLYPVLMYRRNKREQDTQKQLIESLKKGDYIITYSGIFGKIIEIVEKEAGKFIVMETGESNKNYVTISENAVYVVANNNPKVYDSEGNVVTTKPEENKTEKTEKNEETPEEHEKRLESGKAKRKSKKSE